MKNKIDDAIKRHEKKYHSKEFTHTTPYYNGVLESSPDAKATWQPKVGDEVWWDGIGVGAHSEEVRMEPQKIKLDRVPKMNSGYMAEPIKSHPYSFDHWDPILWISFEHLSPIKSKPDPTTKVVVYTFDSDAKMDKYHFYGKPDFERIERENIIEGGKVACLVKFNNKEIHYNPKVYLLKIGNKGAWSQWNCDGTQIAFKQSLGFWEQGNLERIISEIRTAILKSKPKSPDALRLAELEKRIEKDRKECNEIHERMMKND
jgi:hypothetical protein